MKYSIYIEGCYSHKIQKGDTYWNLAKEYNTTVEMIQKANPWYDPNNLPVGCSLCIPKDCRN